MITRREFLTSVTGAGASLTFFPARPHSAGAKGASLVVNDIHSQLNPTRVDRIASIGSEDDLGKALIQARAARKPVCIAGGRHAMGGQQFANGAVLLDTRPMQRVLGLDAEQGVVEAEAGIQWPALVYWLIEAQQGHPNPWGIIQKQTGADRLTLGGALAANAHGRGLALRPIIGDVEAFTLMDANGNLRNCSRTENSDLFRLAIGGYGLFGVITRVRLRLMRRTKLERLVELIDIENLMPLFERRIAEGFLYGDCQFSTDISSDGYLRKGVFSCYRPLPHDAFMPTEQKELGEAHWRTLYYLSHADTRRAYDAYTAYYLSTSGQRYWSDTGQLSVYIDNYHRDLDRRLRAKIKGTEMISELYVPRSALTAFLDAVRSDFRKNAVQLIYGTIRLIEADDESFLAWAREPWVCMVVNLHVDHSERRIRKTAEDFRRLIDHAIAHGGSYFLTYHRWASKEQVRACYPQMPEFLRLKRHHDPDELFQSNWYSHHKQMFSATL